ncbi:MAG: hypothetical protein GEU94_04865 [Micromonosporaceae bacterium]|nr:hypothetical protein [Micromonosporaceae bacterium]
MSQRMVPFHCPYCGEEDLRPNESGHGAWECRSCLRVFSVKFIGMIAPARTTPSGPDQEETR